jgi:hypothetical protein
MFDVILYQPEIPPNTGNIIRLCANTGARLHLVKPLGFSLEDKQLVRAGLDYHEFATLSVYETWAECAERFNHGRLFAVSTRNTRRYDCISYIKGRPIYWNRSKLNGAFVFRCDRKAAVSISPTRSLLSCMRLGGRLVLKTLFSHPLLLCVKALT